MNIDHLFEDENGNGISTDSEETYEVVRTLVDFLPGKIIFSHQIRELKRRD